MGRERLLKPTPPKGFSLVVQKTFQQANLVEIGQIFVLLRP
jgi:hypothetical protein